MWDMQKASGRYLITGLGVWKPRSKQSKQTNKLTQFLVITTTKGVKRPEKLKKGQKNFEGQNKGRIWKKFNFLYFF